MKTLFRYAYQCEININASKKDVWDILISAENYPKWNPFTVQVETNWQLGQKVLLHVKMNPKKKPILQTEYLSKLKPKDEIAWGIHWGLFLKAQRLQKLTTISDSRTTYFTEDVIWGLLSPIVNLLYGKSIQAGFEKMAKALKNYAESRHDD